MTQEYREIRRYNINSFFLIDVVLSGGVRLRDGPNERLRRIPKSSTKVLAHLPTFTVSFGKTDLSVRPLSPPIQCCLSCLSRHCSFAKLSGGKGVPYSSDVIRFYLQNTLSTHFRSIWSRYAKDFCRGRQPHFQGETLETRLVRRILQVLDSCTPRGLCLFRKE